MIKGILGLLVLLVLGKGRSRGLLTLFSFRRKLKTEGVRGLLVEAGREGKEDRACRMKSPADWGTMERKCKWRKKRA